MKKLFIYLIVSIISMLFSCSVQRKATIMGNNFMGVYTGSNVINRKTIGYNYRLELKEDGTCKFNKYSDIYNIIGLGKWAVQGKSIIIEYDNPPTDIPSLLMGGSYMQGIDTLKICSAKKLKNKKEKVILKK